MNYFELSASEYRDIILGKISFRKCMACDNNGKEYWDESGTSVLPYPHPDWGENYDCGPCEACKGLGFVQSN